MSGTERFKLISAVYLLLIKEGKVLLLRRFQTGYEDGNYSLVAGHLNGGESMKSAMVREAKEEAGIIIDEADITHALTLHRLANDERIELFFTAEKWEGEITNMEPEKCDDLSWFPLDQLPENTIPYIRTVIEAYLKGDTYVEIGWEK